MSNPPNNIINDIQKELDEPKENKIQKILKSKWMLVIVGLILFIVLVIIIMMFCGDSNKKGKDKDDEDDTKEKYATMTPLTDNQQLKYQSDSIYDKIDAINRIQEAAL